MTKRTRLTSLVTLGCITALLALPQIQAHAQDKISAEEARAIAVDAYLYFYPLVSMDITRLQSTNIEPGKEFAKGPMNMFVSVPEYPPADLKVVVRVNFDTLYSVAWLDLTKEPLIVSAPDTDGRYYLLPMLDMWTDVFASPGWRTTGTQAPEGARMTAFVIENAMHLKHYTIRCILTGVLLAWAAHAAADAEPTYVGRAQCATCHAEENARWSGSHHDLAMQEASDTSVLGDFDDARFEQFGVTSRFYRQDGVFMVRTEGPDGALHDYPIKYTFGVYPLQQYLIAFPGGRLQALDIAWDSRPEAEGGQRWMHLHPDDPVRHDDVLHWTGPNLNWNFMCADCHSTNLRKGYDPASDSYHSTWSEIDVSCEACHGPGSRHLEWAAATGRGETSDIPEYGLTVRFDERAGVAWRIDPDTGLPKRSKPRTSAKEIHVCARCHSRRSQMTDDMVAGQPFLDGFQPALLTEGLYYPDGQMQDEVYVWGSFLQSKMHQAGVTCSDCHDPHAADLRVPGGDATCVQCHAPARYASTAHHFHPPDSRGASCIECHMPPTTFMVVDARHDHSFRIPRPDLSLTMGTPNACTQCHADQTDAWAARHTATWYGEAPQPLAQSAQAMQAARAGHPAAGQMLQAIAANPAQPAITRATALQALADYPDNAMLTQVQQSLNSPDPLLRLGALHALATLGPTQRRLAVPLLGDANKAIRIEAARLLAGLPTEAFTPQEKERLAQGIEEYIAVQTFNAERPEAQVNLGVLYADLGRYQEAEQAYRQAIAQQPQFVPASVNLALLLSERGQEPAAERLLRQGLTRNPDSADLHHALGLSLVRQQRLESALVALAKAAELAPNNLRYGYVHAVALQANDQIAAAIQVLERLDQQSPANLDILSALVNYHRQIGEDAKALEYARRLPQQTPANPAARSP
ncbi:putative PEP-CTERM system TPR-repeat lipoprotein [Thiorhodovibrio winogradskyi]|uniref:PEP-CTERM system TPR-repeat lipoprotein n=1 Tax=Thiorhodovibrio winogradskyi TaxID=77007 RepID=A0ABZ0SEY7_9GAMM|nr:DUF1254 domain-containing protein [Thiorhodovibrio winogradskyi]